MKKIFTMGLALLLALIAVISVTGVVFAADPPDPPAVQGGRPVAGHPIYVVSQDMYYDTFVPVEPLVWNGHNTASFQPLTPDGSVYGPGDPEHRGGRWWVDLNGNGYQDPEGIDHYVLCPLLGPARSEP